MEETHTTCIILLKHIGLDPVKYCDLNKADLRGMGRWRHQTQIPESQPVNTGRVTNTPGHTQMVKSNRHTHIYTRAHIPCIYQDSPLAPNSQI